MRAKPFASITGPMSRSTTPAIAVGCATARSMQITPPRELPTKTAGPISRAVNTATTSASSTIVVLRIGVVFGKPAPAGVDCHYAARGAAVRQLRCQRVEVRDCARKAGQAYDCNGRGHRGAIFADMQSQAVLCRDKNAPAGVLGRRFWRDKVRGSLNHRGQFNQWRPPVQLLEQRLSLAVAI
jgi:hypothetical protein